MLKRRKRCLKKEETAPNPGDYRALFVKACQRSINFDIGNADLLVALGTPLDEFLLDRLQFHIGDIVTNMLGGHLSNLAGQCFAVNLELSRRLAEEGFRASVTWGSIYTTNNGRLFGINTEEVEDLIRMPPKSRTKLNMHSWLTLTSMEVIDVTIMASFAEVWGDESLLGHVVAGLPENLPTIRYLPQVVGERFPFTAGLVIGMAIEL